MAETINDQIDQSELSHQEVMDQARLCNECERLNIDKIGALRILLGDSWLGGPKENPSYFPVLNPEESKIVRKKIFELIERL